MPLTPEQEALKQAALEAYKGSWARSMSDFDALSSPAAILALLAQLEAAQEDNYYKKCSSSPWTIEERHRYRASMRCPICCVAKGSDHFPGCSNSEQVPISSA